MPRTLPFIGDFRDLPDLAVRTLGGAVVYANDESFAEREALVLPTTAGYDDRTFGHKGKLYDGWETRRRREPGHDVAIIRLGAPGIVHGVVVDTAWFRGNFPPEVSVEAAFVPGHPAVADLLAHDEWETVVERNRVVGDEKNLFDVESNRCWTHLRLSIYPDGGVARFRVHGEVLLDPLLADACGTLDLAALENGGRVLDCSNIFYSSPNNLISRGLTRTMGEGWETARRRDDGNDWVLVRLAAQGTVGLAELDTTYFLHNAPGQAGVRGVDLSGVPDADSVAIAGRDVDGAELVWVDLLERTVLQPDTRHRFVLEPTGPVTHVRLDIYPDGGMARLRLLGLPTDVGRQSIAGRWTDAR